MLITFEGIDNSGKTTQIRLLKKKLIDEGFDVLELREPGGTEISEEIRDLLLHSKNDISPSTELLLFEAARSELVQKVIEPALKSGYIVLLDRFFDSTTAYQGFGRKLNLDLVQSINAFATNGRKPDLTFYIELSFEESNSRNPELKKDRIERAGIEFFNRVNQGFKEIALEEDYRFVIIDGLKSIDKIHEEVLTIVLARLSKF